jgi:hypothetical protein
MKRIVFGLLLLLSAEVVYLSIRNQELISAQKRLDTYLSAGEAISANSGLELGLMQIADWQTGKVLDVREYQEGQEALIFNLSTTCSLCEEASIYWNALYFKYGDKYKIFGLARDYKEQIAQYVERNAIHFPIFNILKTNHSFDSVIGRTPRTIVVDREGSISDVYEGVGRDLDKKLSKSS